MPTTLTSMTPAAIVSSIVESTSRQLEGTFTELESTFSELESTFSELEGTFSELEGTFGKLEGTSVGVEIVSIEQDGISRNQATADSGVEVAWAGSCLLIRAHVTIGTSPRDIRYEPSYRKARADDDGQHAAERGGCHKSWSS